MRHLLLLDGMSLAYRAFYALPPDLVTENGTVTNAAYGFTSMLIKVLADEEPDGIAVVFDAPGPNFRHELDPDYKGTRKPTPELFSPQIPLIHEVLEAVQVPMISVGGVEADDVIATLAVQAAAEGTKVTIVTGDRDSYQLVSDPYIEVLYNKRGVSDYARYDEKGILERTGVVPSKYVDYAAMRGDPSDNLPGVAGVGEKTAAKLIDTYGDLEGILANVASLTPKLSQNMSEAADRLRLNKSMMTLVTDVDIPAVPADLVIGPWQEDAVREVFSRLEFRSLLPRLEDALGHGSAQSNTVEVDVETLTGAQLHAFLGDAADGGHTVAVAGPGLGAGGWAVAVEGRDKVAWIDPPMPLDPDTAALFAQLMSQSGPPLVIHGAKAMYRENPTWSPNLRADTEVMAYLLEPGSGTYTLDMVARRFAEIELSAGNESAQGTLGLDLDDPAKPEAVAAFALLQAAGPVESALERAGMLSLWQEMERPLISVIAHMERLGILVDRSVLSDLSARLSKEIADLEVDIHSEAGHSFNINSTKQLREVLFDELGIQPVKKTKTGPSTDHDSLTKMASHPIIAKILRYREIQKLRSTYVDAFPPLIARDGRIHARFNQTATATGRVSSDSPNMQNIPVRSEEGREIRQAFVASPGSQLCAADYSQIELRVLAHLADEPALIDAFNRGADVHLTTAAAVFDVPESDVTPEHRRFAKVVNYGLAYGMEAYGLSSRMGVEVSEAKAILDAYWAEFPAMRAYMEEVVEDARMTGYTTTLFGRRRQLPELRSDNWRVRQMGERMAQNAPIQGTAADLFKKAMLDVDAVIAANGFATRMLLNVHDEILFEVPEDEIDDVVPQLVAVMENVYPLRVPLVVDSGIGPNWEACKPTA